MQALQDQQLAPRDTVPAGHKHEHPASGLASRCAFALGVVDAGEYRAEYLYKTLADVEKAGIKAALVPANKGSHTNKGVTSCIMILHTNKGVTSCIMILCFNG